MAMTAVALRYPHPAMAKHREPLAAPGMPEPNMNPITKPGNAGLLLNCDVDSAAYFRSLKARNQKLAPIRPKNHDHSGMPAASTGR